MLLWFRHRLLDWVLFSRVPPFSWLYRALYWAARRAVVRSLRRLPGLVAVYLTGSMATGTERLGLSDIDFKVFLTGRRDVAVMRDIARRFLRLRRFFPMLGPPDDKGIFFLDDLRDEAKTFPLVRLFFDPRFYRHRLLVGTDCLTELQIAPLDHASAQEVLPWRLKQWNEKMLLLCDAASFSSPQQRYLLWKILADMGRFLQLRQPTVEVLLDRESAVERLRASLPDEHQSLVAASQAEHKRGFRADRLSQADRFALWRAVLTFMATARAETPASLTTVATPRTWPLEDDPHGPELVALAPPDARMRLTDFFFLPASPLDVEWYGSRVRLIELPRPLRLAEYSRLKAGFRRGTLGPEPIFVLDQGLVGHCVWSAMTDHFLVVRGGDDGFRAFVQGEEAASLDRHGMRRRLDRLLAQLASLLDDDQLPRLGPDRLARFGFVALTACFLADEVERPRSGSTRLHLPAGPDELIGLLRAQGLPEKVATVLDGARAFLAGAKTLVGSAAFIDLVRFALDVAHGRRKWSDAAISPRPRPRISLVLITRDRAGMLRRCLASLLAQTRPADELIVVDNGSSDDTAAVVQELATTHTIRYLFEPTPGVGRARSTGCAAASGDIFAFIDDDAVAEPDWLASIEQALALDPRIGVVGGRIDPLSNGREDFLSRAFDRLGEAPSC